MIHLVDSIGIPCKSQAIYEQVRNQLEPLLNAIRRKDPHYEGHVRRACFYALEFSRQQNLSEKEIRRLYLGTFFHDIGKVLIPSEIINKKGPLSTEERKVMMNHADLGEKICLGLGPFEEIAELVGSHHERPNGTGYPRGRHSGDISELSRILAIIEIYDALRSKRSYKQPYSREQSLEILYQNARDGNLDLHLTEAFVKLAVKITVPPDLGFHEPFERQKI